MTDEGTENRVWCSVETTVNLGNYENVKIMMGESVTVKPDEDSRKKRKRLCFSIAEDVEDMARNYKEGE